MCNIKTILLFIALCISHIGVLKAQLHPKVEEALNREKSVEGFVFDIQSNDADYFDNNLDYIRDQLDTIYDYSPHFRVIIVSRGKEMQSLLMLNHMKPIFQMLQDYHFKYNLSVEVDIQVAIALGYTEKSFPRIIKVINDAHASIVSGKAEDMAIIELQKMTQKEKKRTQLSPTWRTDTIN